MFKIPIEIKSYPEGQEPKMDNHDSYEYEPVDGEKIKVVFWVRYPSYDFIFGVPDKSSSKYEKEIGFFQFRDTRASKVISGFYIDIEECKELVKGFSDILATSIENSPHLWKEDKKKE